MNFRKFPRCILEPGEKNSISSNLAFLLAIHIFTKTRFSSHINFISRCLQHKVIPKGFRSNVHASSFSNVSNFNLKYLHEIQRTQNTFSHNIMKSTIRAMCSKRNELNKQIIECRSQLSNVCPSVLVRSIHSFVPTVPLCLLFLYAHCSSVFTVSLYLCAS